MFSSLMLHFNYSFDFNHHALSHALMHMNALQDRCVASEGVIRRFHKCQEIENKEQAQYSEVVCTLN